MEGKIVKKQEVLRQLPSTIAEQCKARCVDGVVKNPNRPIITVSRFSLSLGEEEDTRRGGLNR